MSMLLVCFTLLYQNISKGTEYETHICTEFVTNSFGLNIDQFELTM